MPYLMDAISLMTGVGTWMQQPQTQPQPLPYGMMHPWAMLESMPMMGIGQGKAVPASSKAPRGASPKKRVAGRDAGVLQRAGDMHAGRMLGHACRVKASCSTNACVRSVRET